VKNRNLLVVLKSGFMSEEAIEQQVDSINNILYQVESAELFCTAHELVDRNRITSNPNKLLRESSYRNLRTFRFLINKN
jgi:hypothetical protein